MDKIRKLDRAEAKIQEEIEKKLILLGWFVKSTHGNIYSFGFPDLYVAHRMYGARWIEVKRPDKYSFTNAQLEYFPQMSAAGVGVWVCNDAAKLPDLLFKPPNWHQFLSVMK